MGRLQRRQIEGQAQPPTTLERFYDIVFAFAITQVAHLLLENLTWAGAGQALIVLMAVWWSWNFTTWVTNELDPETISVRLLLIGLMFASLIMAVAIPQAFGDQALVFAGAYVAIQVGRHLFLTFVSAEPGSVERGRAGRILTWFVAAGVLWIAGALAGGTALVVLWIGALVLDYGGPALLFWLPGRGRATATTWFVETAHFAERFRLFILLVLGELIIIIGATTDEVELGAARIAAFGIAFLGTAALWWLYFDYDDMVAERRLELSQQPTLLARDAYTYLHVPIIAGVIVAAAGSELVISHPLELLLGPEVTAVVGGPAIYLLSHSLFRYRVTGYLNGKRLFGALGCVAVGIIGLLVPVPALVVGVLLIGVLGAVIVSEYVASARRKARGEPSPLERLEASASGQDQRS